MKSSRERKETKQNIALSRTILNNIYSRKWREKRTYGVLKSFYEIAKKNRFVKGLCDLLVVQLCMFVVDAKPRMNCSNIDEMKCKRKTREKKVQVKVVTHSVNELEWQFQSERLSFFCVCGERDSGKREAMGGKWMEQ